MPDTPELARARCAGWAIRTVATLRSETVHIQEPLARYLVESLAHIDALTAAVRPYSTHGAECGYASELLFEGECFAVCAPSSPS